MSGKEIRVGLLVYGAIGDEHNQVLLADGGCSLFQFDTDINAK